LNCWGGISVNGATSLHIFKGSLKGTVYQETLEEHISEMEEPFPDGYYFQHDKHSSHTCCED